MNFRPPKIYPITDTGLSGLADRQQVEMLIEGGAQLIQLRDKHVSPRDFYQAAVEAVRIADAYNVGIIVNDRVDIALAVKTAGVHLGQDDMPTARARAMLGQDAIIGLSTHSLEQALSALLLPVDYIAVGPIFLTHTKSRPDPVVGLDTLRHIRNATGDIPLVAIGGIGADTLGQVFASGADSAAVIGAILADPSKISMQMRRFIDLSVK